MSYSANEEAAPFHDPVELETRLSRLPPAQPCLRCPSHDAKGDLRLISPQLHAARREDGWSFTALFVCALCGEKQSQALAD